LICELEMPKIYHAKNPTFGNLDSLTNHYISRSNAYAFSAWNLQNKNNSALKRPLITFCVESTSPNNPLESSSSIG